MKISLRLFFVTFTSPLKILLWQDSIIELMNAEDKEEFNKYLVLGKSNRLTICDDS